MGATGELSPSTLGMRQHYLTARRWRGVYIEAEPESDLGDGRQPSDVTGPRGQRFESADVGGVRP
jgi:hypothetical protein